MNSTFVPKLWNWSLTILPADWLIETSKITAPTPMTIPSTVRSGAGLVFQAATAGKLAI